MFQPLWAILRSQKCIMRNYTVSTTNDLILYSFSSLYIFVTWGWPTVAETCPQPNKTDTKTVVFWHTHPLLICIKHDRDDASKDSLSSSSSSSSSLSLLLSLSLFCCRERRKVTVFFFYHSLAIFLSVSCLHKVSRYVAEPSWSVNKWGTFL